eukprot:6846231-Pyramimonas_sp.AAC.1
MGRCLHAKVDCDGQHWPMPCSAEDQCKRLRGCPRAQECRALGRDLRCPSRLEWPSRCSQT